MGNYWATGKSRGWRWWFHIPGNVYAYGPTAEYYTTERTARAAIREWLGAKRLPAGTGVWKATDNEYI